MGKGVMLRGKEQENIYPVTSSDLVYDPINKRKINEQINEIVSSVENKVDKEEGKKLSSNDYTNTDKNKLDGIESGAQVNSVIGVKGDSESSYRKGNINITKSNIGLGNVDNTPDSEKSVNHANTANEALKSESDGNGNNIVDTYSTKDVVNVIDIRVTALSQIQTNFIGYFDNASILPTPSENSWALVGDLSASVVYAYYISSNIPTGYSEGWNPLNTLGTYDLTDYDGVKSKLNELESRVFNSDTQDWVYNKSIDISPSNQYTILEYLGKTECEFTIEGTSNQSFQFVGYNKKTGSVIPIATHSESVELPIVVSNPRPDLELINIRFIAYSGAVKDTITVTIKKASPFNTIKDDVNTVKNELDSYIEGQSFHDPDILEVSKKVTALPSTTVDILSYLGKTECEFTIVGNATDGRFKVVGYNKKTGSDIVLGNFPSATPATYPLKFTNPRPDLELINLQVVFYSTQVNDTLDITISKETIAKKALDLSKENYNLLEAKKASDFNSDTQDWVYTKSIDISPSNQYTILDYLGKTECEFTIEGTANQSFQFVGYNKKTGSVIPIATHSESVELPVVVSNPRPDLELINIRFIAYSGAVKDTITVTIKKASPFNTIKDEVTKLAKESKLVSDIPFSVYTSDNKFDSALIGKITSSEIYAEYDALMETYPDYITKTFLGNEATGIPMYRYDFKPKWEEGAESVPRIKVMILTGTHPEYIAIRSLIKVMSSICNDWSTNEQLEALRFNVEFIIIPVASPWAVDNSSRVNSNGVDMNRNYPALWTQGTYVEPPSDTSTYGGTAPLSELEAQYIYNVYNDNRDIAFGIDFHNQFSNDYTFWLPMYTSSGIAYKVGCAWMKQTDRKTKKKFDYISKDYKIGSSSVSATGGSFKAQLNYEGNVGLTFESCNNNIEGYTNQSDIITITHDAFINYLLINLRYLL